MSASAIFGGKTAFTRYRAELQITDRLIGGIPKDPDTIKAWVRARITAGDDLALQQIVDDTVAAMTAEGGAAPPIDVLLDAVAREMEGGNGFKRIEGQLVYEGRCMKAALKEAANVAYPGTKFPGKPEAIRKGLMRYLAEVVFVEDQHIPLGTDTPSGTEQRIKHVMTPQGPRSAINVVDYIDKPRITFVVSVLGDCVVPEVWQKTWETLEQIGIGADRARSDGKFTLEAWDRID
jgi:hypothetical protein